MEPSCLKELTACSPHLCLPSHWDRQEPTYQAFLWNNYLLFQKSQESLGLLMRHWILNYNGEPWVQLRWRTWFLMVPKFLFPNFLNNNNKCYRSFAAYKTKVLVWFSALPYSRAESWSQRSCTRIASLRHHTGPPGRCCSSGSSPEPLHLLLCLPVCLCVCGGVGGVLREVSISRNSMESIFEKKKSRQLTTPLTESLWDKHGAHLSKLPGW